LAGTFIVSVGVGALEATAGTTSRHALLNQLQRAAVPAAGAGFQATRAPAPGRALLLTMGPNRAAVANRLAVRLTDHGRPVSGARVRISFSMPSMNMWNAYVAALTPEGAGRYTTTVPVLGMTGAWQLRVAIASARATESHVSVIDRMPS
jgi:hypothetical protein